MPFSKRLGACTACGMVFDGIRFVAQLRYTTKDIQLETVCLDCAQMLLTELPELFEGTRWAELRITLAGWPK